MIIKLGIIGFGGMGKWHAQNAPRAGVEIAAVCDIAEEKQKEAIEMVIFQIAIAWIISFIIHSIGLFI